MSLRRIVHGFSSGLMGPLAPLIWTPQGDGGKGRSFCMTCAASGAYERSTCWYDQEEGHAAAGPRCETCDHVVRIERIVEEGKTFVKVLVQCHGKDELHVHDLGSETWDENANEPEDKYDLLRQHRLTARYFVPSEQGELTVDRDGAI